MVTKLAGVAAATQGRAACGRRAVVVGEGGQLEVRRGDEERVDADVAEGGGHAAGEEPGDGAEEEERGAGDGRPGGDSGGVLRGGGEHVDAGRLGVVGAPPGNAAARARRDVPSGHVHTVAVARIGIKHLERPDKQWDARQMCESGSQQPHRTTDTQDPHEHSEEGAAAHEPGAQPGRDDAPTRIEENEEVHRQNARGAARGLLRAECNPEPVLRQRISAQNSTVECRQPVPATESEETKISMRTQARNRQNAWRVSLWTPGNFAPVA